VPIDASARASVKLVKGARLVVYEGGPHGMCSTLKDRVNQELLAFFKEPAGRREEALAAVET
jgi:non-heme chloroperoxidase